MSSSTNQPPTHAPFTITAPPNTDIWRKPPSTNTFSAPSLLRPAMPLSQFNRARITFQPVKGWVERYDQAGLLLVLTSPGEEGKQTQWLKTGIEFYEGKPRLSTVGCDRWADWSIATITDTASPSSNSTGSEHGEITIEVRREGDELGKSLWVYYLVLDADGSVKERLPLREVNWFFASDGDEVRIQVGAFAARPERKEGVGDLEVKFWGFEVE